MLRARQKRRARFEVIIVHVKRFWRHVTDGMNISDLWRQFRSDASSSYKLYSNELDSPETYGPGKSKHFFSLIDQFFWAIIGKLAPARRVLLLIALALLFSDTLWPAMNGGWHTGWSGLAIFAATLLIRHLEDRAFFSSK